MKILAKVIQLLPLNISSMQAAQSDNKKGDKGEEVELKIKQGIEFLKVFANNQIVEDYKLVIDVRATMR